MEDLDSEDEDRWVLIGLGNQAWKEGAGYQTLINRTLRSSLGEEPLSEERSREVIREEIALAKKRAQSGATGFCSRALSASL